MILRGKSIYSPAASHNLESLRATAMQTVAATARRSLKQRRSLESVFFAFRNGMASKSKHPNSRSWPSSGPAPMDAYPASCPINPLCFQTGAKRVRWLTYSELFENRPLSSHRVRRTSPSLSMD